MNIKHINNKDFFNLEDDYNDIIFNGNNVYGNVVAAYLDNNINIVDYKYYLFSTMGKNVKAMNSRNMVLPIREKNSINNPMTYNTILDNKITNNLTNGIYVAEYYAFNAIMSPNEENNLFEYYINSSNLQYSNNTILHIKDFFNTINANRGVNKLLTNKGIRIITFIPENELIEHNLVYNKATDLLFIYGDVNDDIKHPSTIPINEDKPLTTANEVFVSIELIDNETNEARWIKVGSEIVKVLPSKNNMQGRMAKIAINRNNVNILTKTAEPEDYESLGFYKSKEDAITNNDPNAQIALQELEYKKQDIEYKMNKLETEKENAVKELEAIKLKYEKEKEKYELDIAKMKLEMEHKEKLNEMEIERTIVTDSINRTSSYRKLETDVIIGNLKIETNKINLEKEYVSLSKTKVERAGKVTETLFKLFK